MAYVNIPVIYDVVENIDLERPGKKLFSEWRNIVDNHRKIIEKEWERIDDAREQEWQSMNKNVRNVKSDIIDTNEQITRQQDKKKRLDKDNTELQQDNATYNVTFDTLHNVANALDHSVIHQEKSLTDISKKIDSDAILFNEKSCNGNGIPLEDGSCACNPGYDPAYYCRKCLPTFIGKFCDIPCDCSSFGECLEDGSCYCKNNRRGKKCNECMKNMAGTNCDIPCTCNPDGGICDGKDGIGVCSKCYNGYYGINCENKCKGCYNCNDGIDGDGSCNDEECDKGLWGSLCENKCICPDNYVCDDGLKGTGSCTCPDNFKDNCKECKDNHYGIDCIQCNEGCKDCDDGIKGSGNCTQCKDGYYGPNCINRVINNTSINDIHSSILQDLKDENKNIYKIFKNADINPKTLNIENNQTIITKTKTNIINKIKNVDFSSLNKNSKFIKDFTDELIKIYSKKFGISTSKITVTFSQGSFVYNIEIRQCMVNKNPNDCGECNHGYTGSDCQTCKPGWGNGKVVNYDDYSIPNCLSCANNVTGELCDRCENNTLSPESNCTQCNIGFSGNNCSQCDTNYYGDNCQICKCSEHGKCNDGKLGDGSCVCDSGWKGVNCDIEI